MLAFSQWHAKEIAQDFPECWETDPKDITVREVKYYKKKVK